VEVEVEEAVVAAGTPDAPAQRPQEAAVAVVGAVAPRPAVVVAS
jgi:hypothetical protein